jgi:uncharacterized protein YpuA (DUF1002 family)
MIDKKGNKPQLVKHWKDTYNVSLLDTQYNSIQNGSLKMEKDQHRHMKK